MMKSVTIVACAALLAGSPAAAVELEYLLNDAGTPAPAYQAPVTSGQFAPEIIGSTQSANTATVKQTGEHNVVDLVQTGSGHSSAISQGGSGNFLGHYQSGSGKSAVIEQKAVGQMVTVTQY